MIDDPQLLIAALDGSTISVRGDEWQVLVLDLHRQTPCEWRLILGVYGMHFGDVVVAVDPTFELEYVVISVLRSLRDWLHGRGLHAGGQLDTPARVVGMWLYE